MLDIHKRGEDGKAYFDYEKWINYRNSHPFSWDYRKGKFYIDIELVHPGHFISDTNLANLDRPIEFLCQTYPSIHHNYDKNCYYACDEWTIKERYSGAWIDGSDANRILVENGGAGERIILYSSSSSIWDEPWGKKIPNVFCFYKNKFWLVSHLEFLNRQWQFNTNYPLGNRYREMEAPTKFDPMCGSYYPDDFPLPSYFYEDEDPEVAYFLGEILEDPVDDFYFLKFADWLEKKGNDFCDYIRFYVEFDWPEVNFSSFVEEIYNNRPLNIRTAKFLITCLTNDYVRVEPPYVFTL